MSITIDTIFGKAHFDSLSVGEPPPCYEVAISVEELPASVDAG